MLALRIIVGLGLGLLVFVLLGYALSHDKRWLRFGVMLAKVVVALAALILIMLALERVLLVV